jgi:DNA-binding transcriptional MocR family regulator
VWARSAKAHGAIFVTAAAYTLDGRPQPFVRLGFASLNGKELQEGVRRMVAALPR